MSITQRLVGIAVGWILSFAAWGQWDADASADGNLRFAWIHGSLSAKANTDVRVQVHRYNEHTYILRQNPAVHWEAPFMYLLMGEQRAVLFDVGATAETDYFPLRDVVDRVLERWQQANQVDELTLVVMPLGSEASQTAARAQFEDRANTLIVDSDVASRAEILGPSWPSQGSLDLGGRVLEVLATPGIDSHAISVYDAWAEVLLTGNAFFPGRLVIRDHATYLTTLERLVDLSQTKDVRWIWGGRIEMSADPGIDFLLRANYRPNERKLQMVPADLYDAWGIVRLINNQPDIHIHDDFIVMNGVGRGARAYGWPVYIPEMFRKDRTR